MRIDESGGVSVSESGVFASFAVLQGKDVACGIALGSVSAADKPSLCDAPVHEFGDVRVGDAVGERLSEVGANEMRAVSGGHLIFSGGADEFAHSVCAALFAVSALFATAEVFGDSISNRTFLAHVVGADNISLGTLLTHLGVGVEHFVNLARFASSSVAGKP